MGTVLSRIARGIDDFVRKKFESVCAVLLTIVLFFLVGGLRKFDLTGLFSRKAKEDRDVVDDQILREIEQVEAEAATRHALEKQRLEQEHTRQVSDLESKRKIAVEHISSQDADDVTKILIDRIRRGGK